MLSRANVGNMEVAFDAVREDKGDLLADDILTDRFNANPANVRDRRRESGDIDLRA